MISVCFGKRPGVLVLVGLLLALLSAAPGRAATFTGEFWDVSSPNNTIASALAAIDGVAPTATFTSTAIDYPNNGTNFGSSSQTLTQFLGTDAGSIVGNGSATITTSVFRFTGFVDLLPGGHAYSLGSDDGFRLRVNNTTVARYTSPRGFAFTNRTRDVGSGVVPFELIFYENFGRTGVEFFIDGVLAAPAAVPLPATAGLSLFGLGALVLMGRRRKATKIPLASPA